MSTLRNSVRLIGHLGGNPEVREIANGKKVARFSLATNETYKDQSGKKVTETQWHNLIAWNKTADICEKYLVKGKEIAIEGKLTSRNWEDKDGIKRTTTEIIINEILMLSNGQKD